MKTLTRPKPTSTRGHLKAASGDAARAFLKVVRDFADTFGAESVALRACRAEAVAETCGDGEHYARIMTELLEAVFATCLDNAKHTGRIPLGNTGLGPGNVEQEARNLREVAELIALAGAEMKRVAKALKESEATS